MADAEDATYGGERRMTGRQVTLYSITRLDEAITQYRVLCVLSVRIAYVARAQRLHRSAGDKARRTTICIYARIILDYARLRKEQDQQAVDQNFQVMQRCTTTNHDILFLHTRSCTVTLT